jgi:hypothetical protein
MLPTAYSNFLVASTQASAALIGLLFVSVSIAPNIQKDAAHDPENRT